MPPSDSGFKSRDEFRKSYSASDSSIDDENNEGIIRTSSGHHRRRRSRKSKIQRQKRSLTDDNDVILQNNTNNNHQLSAGQELRHISSDAMIYTRNGFGTRKSSESSDVSDLRLGSSFLFYLFFYYYGLSFMLLPISFQIFSIELFKREI